MNPKDGAMLPTDLLPKAQQIIERLVAIDYENPKICEQRIQDAFAQHLKALNLPNRPVEIYRSFFAAFDAAWESKFDAGWETAFEASRDAVLDTAHEVASKAADDAVSEVASDAALEAVLEAALEVALAAVSDAPHAGAFKSAFDAAYETASDAAFNAALRVVRKPASNPLWNAAFNGVFDWAFSSAWSNAKNTVWDDVKKPGSGAAFRSARSAWADSFADSFRASWKPEDDYPSDRAFKAADDAAWDDPSFGTWCNAEGSARDAAFIAAWNGDDPAMEAATEAVSAAKWATVCVNSTTSSPQHEQFCAVWMPFVDAVEARLFCYWVTTTKVIALTLPMMRIEDNRLHQLHADGQPAVQWSDWECYYFWHGTEIPQKYGAVLSDNWRSQWLLKESNAELRRVLIQGIGYDRIVQDLEAVELDAWREYSLLKIQADIDVEPIHLLKMTCPSTNHIHVLRVPPDLTSARAAIRWANWDIDPEAFAAET
jgi:hypothetical protein